MADKALYHRPGWKPVEYEIDAIDGDTCSLKNADGKVFVTDLLIVADPAAAENLPSGFATLVKDAPKKFASKKSAPKAKSLPANDESDD
jgi:hypothetical protein